MTPTALVILPTYNERANLPPLMAGLMKHANVRVLLVDDNSPDGTGALGEELGRQYDGRISVLHRTTNRGFGRSYIDGMKRALGDTADFICQMDADLSHDPAQLPDLLAAVARPDVDMAIGSRYIPGGQIVNWPLKRHILSRFANTYIRTVTRVSAHDCTSGYRVWKKSALATLPLDQFFSDGYSFLVEMLFVAHRRGVRIAEVPITFVERREGESKVSRAVLFESAITPWRLISNPESSRKAAPGARTP